VAQQVLMFHKAYARIAEALSTRVAEVEAVLWDTDGSLTLDGKAVSAADVAPVAAWFSGDVLGGPALGQIAQTVSMLPSIRWIQSANAGLDHPAYANLKGRDIRFSKSSAQSIPIAEYTLAYALEHVQDLAVRRAAQAQGRWQTHRFDELWRSNWLIVGYGHIGRNVAIRAKAFDCHTVVVRQSPHADEYADEVISMDRMAQFLPAADVIVLACPATDATRGMVSTDFLAALKPSALLVNVARGALVDEAALLESLDQGRPARAVLDVFEKEPLPSASPLWSHPRVTVTAHTSNAGSGTRGRGDELFLSNLERFLRDETPTDLVDFG
jgi:phosphoglycerate dehydrogenase-like enzyme